MSTRMVAAAGAVALATGALAAPSSASTKVVDVGGHGFKGAPKNLQALAYRRSVVTVRVGDSVAFRLKSGLIHTATFVPRGQAVPTLTVNDAANPVKGLTDASGTPFWFNGQPRVIVNPKTGLPTALKTVTGTAYVNSGLPADNTKDTTVRFTFPKRGSFKFVCLVHPGMQGRVKVVPGSAHVPSARQDRAAAKRETAAIVSAARAKAKLRAPAAQVDVGRTGPALTINAMFPETITVKAGSAVRFSMAGQSRLEIHTVTIGPNTYTEPIEKALIAPAPNPAGGPPALVFNPLAVFPSDPPPLSPHTANHHGNGFLNLGVLDNDSRTPLPASASITFSTPGTYQYQCVLHPQMDGTVVVTQ